MADADARPGAARCAIGAAEDRAVAGRKAAQRESCGDPSSRELDQPRAAQFARDLPLGRVEAGQDEAGLARSRVEGDADGGAEGCHDPEGEGKEVVRR